MAKYSYRPSNTQSASALARPTRQRCELTGDQDRVYRRYVKGLWGAQELAQRRPTLEAVRQCLGCASLCYRNWHQWLRGRKAPNSSRDGIMQKALGIATVESPAEHFQGYSQRLCDVLLGFDWAPVV